MLKSQFVRPALGIGNKIAKLQQRQNRIHSAVDYRTPTEFVEQFEITRPSRELVVQLLSAHKLVKETVLRLELICVRALPDW